MVDGVQEVSASHSVKFECEVQSENTADEETTFLRLAYQE